MIGETGFEPATARPPAGAIQAYPPRFGARQHSELLGGGLGCAQFGPRIGPRRIDRRLGRPLASVRDTAKNAGSHAKARRASTPCGRALSCAVWSRRARTAARTSRRCPGRRGWLSGRSGPRARPDRRAAPRRGRDPVRATASGWRRRTIARCVLLPCAPADRGTRWQRAALQGRRHRAGQRVGCSSSVLSSSRRASGSAAPRGPESLSHSPSEPRRASRGRDYRGPDGRAESRGGVAATRPT